MGYEQDNNFRSPSYTFVYRRLPLVYSRDFAYANSTTVVLRMARGNIAESTARSFADLLSGPTVSFYIGPERRQWSVHRNLLCHHSSYFEAEFLNNEVPPKSGELKLELPEEDTAGFELLVKWLYQGRLDDMAGMTDEAKYDYSVACHKLYMLCDKFDLPLKNEAIDRYRQGLSEAQLVPDAEEINDIYSRSPLGSPFRKLMTQIAARQIMDPDSDKDAESYRRCFENNPDFAVDMVNAIKAGTGGVLFNDPTDGNQCDYHDHSDGQHCHVKGKGRLISHPRRTTRRLSNTADSVIAAKSSQKQKPQSAPPLSLAQDKINRMRSSDKLRPQVVPNPRGGGGANGIPLSNSQQHATSQSINGVVGGGDVGAAREQQPAHVNGFQRQQLGRHQSFRRDSVLSSSANTGFLDSSGVFKNHVGSSGSSGGGASNGNGSHASHGNRGGPGGGRGGGGGTGGTGAGGTGTIGTSSPESPEPAKRKQPPKLRRRPQGQDSP